MLLRILATTLVILSTFSMTGCGSNLASPPREIPPPECELRIEVPAQIKQDAHGQIKVRINNVGDAPVTLVLPGDGSEVSWRTPVIKWSLTRLDPPDSKAAAPLGFSGGRCGNVNKLDLREIFTLKPGETQKIGQWVNLPYGMPPGQYSVVFHYSNIPDMKWQGVPLGKHDPAAMQQVKRSTPISLVSNEVIVEIIK
jgi:hypothetical protein